MNNRKIFFKGLLTGLLAAAILAGGLFSVKAFVIDAKDAKVRAILEKAIAIDGIIDEYYLEDADLQAMADAMYKAMIESLGDKYSEYYSAEEYKALMESVSGYYKGIGVSVIQDDSGNTVVNEVFGNSPANDAGIQPGDIIFKVDGTEVTGMDLDVIVGMIKGEEGTEVTVIVKRNSEEITYVMERRQVEVPTVYGEILENNIGYISIAGFDTVTPDQFETTLNELKDGGMTSLIIDVRDNPGGTLDSVTGILDQLLPEGLTVYTEDKYGNRDEYNSDEATKLEIPMVVLINENSASASEIFAGAIKDFEAATIVGKTTYGKGVMQAIRSFTDGSALKITTAYFYTPKGTVINGVGIVPDVEIEIPVEAYEDYVITPEEDVQLQKAIEIISQ